MRKPLTLVALAVALSIAGAASSGDPRAPTPAERALPWLRGMPASAVAASASRAAAARLAAVLPPGAGCPTGDDSALEIVADLAPEPGLETLLVSYGAGAILLDARGATLASSPPFVCYGSADAVEGVAVGDLLLDAPVVALAATAGGHAERATWIVLYAVRRGALARIFAAPVEEVHGDARLVGEVTVVPGGALRHRAPSGDIGIWRYDPAAGRYLLRERVPAPRPAPVDPAPGPVSASA